MSIKTTGLVCAATLTLAAAVCAAGSPPAGAATPQCGPHCVQIFSARYGTPASPNFVESVSQGLAAAGNPTVLQAPSSTDSAGDMIVSRAGPVSLFFAAGMVSADVAQAFTGETAVQVQYAPRGVPTGLCAGVAAAAYQNEGLTLQPCQTPGSTVFILDRNDSPTMAPSYFPIVIGNTTDFVHPFTMTMEGDPAHLPLPQIQIEHLRGNSVAVPLNQLWGANVLN